MRSVAELCSARVGVVFVIPRLMCVIEHFTVRCNHAAAYSQNVPSYVSLFPPLSPNRVIGREFFMIGLVTVAFRA